MKKTINPYIALCLTVIALGAFSCAEEFESPKPVTGSTLAEVAATDTTLQIFTAAIAKTGIDISLGNINSGQHTVFAPTDSAFRVYFRATLSKPTTYNDDSVINYINTKMTGSSTIALGTFTTRLQYHVVSSNVPSADITPSKVLTTINGARLSLSKKGNTVYVNGNTNANGAKSKQLDLTGANGTIHTINKFLTAITSTTTVVGTNLGISINYAAATPVVTVGATTGSNYDLFANAIKKTGLATTIRPNVPAANLPDYTVFAPDDAAMVTYLGELSGGTVTDEATALTYINGLAAGTALTTLTDVVKYHITTGRVLSTDVSEGQALATLLTGKTILVDQLMPSSIVLEDATGEQTTLTIANANVLNNAGVLHRLGGVLEPQ